ncbi:MAG TPA: hypothetical protein DIW52_05155 [Pseudomonas sp.]|nr:hypothetical protein [Pseudomonas sp.]
MRRIVCRRFGASICLGALVAGCKNDRGIAESVNLRQRVVNRPDKPPVQARPLAPESVASLDFLLMLHWNKGRRRDEIDLPGFGSDSHRRTGG